MKKWFENDYLIRLWLSSIVFAILGAILFVLAFNIEDGVWINILNSIGAVLIVSGIYNVIYEYILKSKLINLIIDKVKLKKSIDELGIDNIFLISDDVPYRDYIKETKESIVIVHAYGLKWTTNYIENITDLCLQRCLDIKVVLLSVKSDFCDSIDKHYNKENGNMVKSIEKATEYWRKLGDKVCGKSKVKVFYYDGNPVHSLYMFDKKIVVVSNKISNTVSSKLPCVVCIQKEDSIGGIYRIYKEEIDDLLRNGNVIYSNVETKNERDENI